MTRPSLTIVIPTLNEAHHLSELLPQIAGQTLRPGEVIVADAGSSDLTCDIGRAHGARVVPGGRPADGRNSGGHAAAGDWLCFIDADTRLPARDTLERAIATAVAQGVSALVGDYRPYYRTGDRGYDRPLVRVWDRLMLRAVSDGQRLYSKLGFPIGQALFLVTRRDVFLDIGGFDRNAEPFEDSEYLLRVHRHGQPQPGRRSAVGTAPRGFFVLVSMRRYDVSGRLIFPAWMAICGAFYRLLFQREHPDHHYWDLNRLGLYRERRSPLADSTPGVVAAETPLPPATTSAPPAPRVPSTT